MPDDDKVEVFHFHKYDGETNVSSISPFMVTAEYLKQYGLKGVEGSVRIVHWSDLVGKERYYPKS